MRVSNASGKVHFAGGFDILCPDPPYFEPVSNALLGSPLTSVDCLGSVFCGDFSDLTGSDVEMGFVCSIKAVAGFCSLPVDGFSREVLFFTGSSGSLLGSESLFVPYFLPNPTDPNFFLTSSYGL